MPVFDYFVAEKYNSTAIRETLIHRVQITEALFAPIRSKAYQDPGMTQVIIATVMLSIGGPEGAALLECALSGTVAIGQRPHLPAIISEMRIGIWMRSSG